MSSTATALSNLKQQRPEWGPWLAVIEETLRDVGTPIWDTAIPTNANTRDITTPLLAGAALSVERRAVRALTERLIHVASHTATPQMMTLRSVLDANSDVLSLFEMSLSHNSEAIKHAAAFCGADGGAYEAVISLLCVPFLQACNRQSAPSVGTGWVEGYCYLCGAWPTFAEARGIERKRFFRCGRCGSGWHARPLRCPYCGVDDHHALVSLVPEQQGVNATIEGCRSCFGYIKTFTRLQGCLPVMVTLDDLATVHLDVAAIDQGYKRPPGLGYPLAVTVTGKAARGGVFGWNA